MFKKTKVRSILELLGKNLSAREVSKVLGVSRNTVAEVQTLFLQSGRTWDDDRLYELFYPDKFKYKPRYAPVDYSYVHRELKKTGVTEKLLWEEYCARCKKDGVKGCSYITFARNYKKFTADKNYTSHIEHKPGLEVEVDWSGPAMSYTEPDTGKHVTAYLFVATMPYSQISYVEAATSMDEKAWLTCHVNMFQFFGGTPVKIVCDNLKTGVTSHPKRGEIVLNEAYLSLGEYYSVAIMPTGVKKPKQKASVEGSVGKIAKAVIAKLRNDTFTSLTALNVGIHKYKAAMREVEELDKQKEILEQQNDDLVQKTSELRGQVQEMETQNNELVLQTQELIEQIAKVEAKEKVAQEVLAKHDLRAETFKMISKEVAAETKNIKGAAVPTANLFGGEEYVKVKKSDWNKILDAFSKAVSRNHLLEKYEKKISNLEKKIAVLTDQIEKLKRFIASRGLGEAFVEFVKSLAPKTMKQKLEEAKEEAVEHNQQRKSSKKDIGRKNKQWQQEM